MRDRVAPGAIGPTDLGHEMKRRIRARDYFRRNQFGIAALAILSASCASLRFERPTAELEALQITSLGLSGGALTLVLDVYNPNSYEVHTIRIQATLDLEETHMADAVLDESVVLAPTSHTEVAIPVTFTWEGLGVGARALLSRGEVAYVLQATLLIDVGIGTRDLRLRAQGVVPIEDLIR